MRIHRLRLQDFRGVTDREVTFPDNGVVVLEGRNELGKTSMVEAFDLLLSRKSTSQSREIKATKPVGRDAGPTVEAEISTGPYRFTLRKRWLRRPETVLAATEPRRLSLTGDEAHDWVQAALDETLDRSLFEALRLMQATDLSAVSLGASNTLTAALDAAAGSSADAGVEGDELLGRVEEEYRRYRSAQGRESGELRAAREELAAAEDDLAVARAGLRAIEGDVEEAATLTAGLEQAEAALRESAERRVALEEDWSALEALRRELLAADDRHAAAAREADRARADAAARTEDVVEVAAAVARAEQDLVDADRLAEQQEPVETLMTARAEELAAAQGRLDGLRDEERRLRRELDACRAADELQRITARLASAEDAVEEQRAVRAEVAALQIDDAAVRRLEETSTRLTQVIARRDATAARLSVELLGDSLPAGSALRGGPDDVRPLGEGVVPVHDTVEVEVPGLLRLTVTPGARGQLDDAVHEAEADHADALAIAGVPDLATARARVAELGIAEQRLTEATRRCEELLGGETVDELRARVAEAASRWEGLTSTSPGAPSGAGEDTSPPVAAAEEALAATEEQVDDLVRAVAELRLASEALLRASGSHRDAVIAARARADISRGSAESLEARLAGRRQRMSDADLALAVEQAERRVTETGTELEGLRGREAGTDPALEELVRSADAAVSATADRADALRADLVRTLARLEASNQQGLHELRDRADQRVRLALEELARVERRDTAVTTLRETLLAHRRAAQQSYVEPFRDAVTRLGTLVYGRSFDVEVDDDLSLSARTLNGETVPFTSLSSGAREQLAILTRLACAQVVDEREGVPVILDDALGYTDPVRLERMQAALGAVGARSQVILLTSTPARYAGVAGALHVRLDEAADTVDP